MKTSETKNNTGRTLLVCALLLATSGIYAQTPDEERMNRDIKVAENVLSALIKNELNNGFTFFGIEVTGSYQPGYGVTFRVPGDQAVPFRISTLSGAATVVTSGGQVESYHYAPQGTRARVVQGPRGVSVQSDSGQESLEPPVDSARLFYNDVILTAAKDFIVDYGDFLSQLQPGEKIIVTNRNQRTFRFFNLSRTHIQVEGTKGDITAFRQGKLTRDQLMQKLTVVNTQTMEERDTELELLISIFDRLYRPDLSSTYFTGGNLYYERLKDYGAIVYMQVFSSRGDGVMKIMPTLDNVEMPAEERDRKVAELYPKFERELMENIAEYGRRIKSLNPNEMLIFNVTLTKCPGCGIPSTLEVSVSNSVLRDYDAGKIDMTAALAKMTVKKGPKQ